MSVEQLHAIRGPHAGQCQRLAEVLSLTRDMLDCADRGDWDAVTRMERDRRASLQSCFSESAAPEFRELIAEALAAMLHLNEELMAKLRNARSEVLRRGVEQARTRSAIGEYQGIKHTPA